MSSPFGLALVVGVAQTAVGPAARLFPVRVTQITPQGGTVTSSIALGPPVAAVPPPVASFELHVPGAGVVTVPCGPSDNASPLSPFLATGEAPLPGAAAQAAPQAYLVVPFEQMMGESADLGDGEVTLHITATRVEVKEDEVVKEREKAPRSASHRRKATRVGMDRSRRSSTQRRKPSEQPVMEAPGACVLPGLPSPSTPRFPVPTCVAVVLWCVCGVGKEDAAPLSPRSCRCARVALYAPCTGCLSCALVVAAYGRLCARTHVTVCGKAACFEAVFRGPGVSVLLLFLRVAVGAGFCFSVFIDVCVCVCVVNVCVCMCVRACSHVYVCVCAYVLLPLIPSPFCSRLQFPVLLREDYPGW